MLRRGSPPVSCARTTNIRWRCSCSPASLSASLYGQEPIEDYPKRVVDELLRGLAAR